MEENKNIYLSEEEQEYLTKVVKTGIHSAKEIIRARVLLRLDRTGKTDHVRYSRIAEEVGVSRQSVYNMRDEYLEHGDIDKYLKRKQRETPPVPPKVDGKVEAEIIALACSKPPEGCVRWTLKLLASKAVEMGFVESLSDMTVQRLLKKRNISLI